MTDLTALLDQVHYKKAVDLIDSLLDNSVDCFGTDPPYTTPKSDTMIPLYADSQSEDWGIDKCEGGFTEEKGLKNLPRYTTKRAGKEPTWAQGMAYAKWIRRWAKKAYAKLKPGGYILVFNCNEMYHWMAVGLSMAGFEIRDKWEYCYAKGMPTGQRRIANDIAKVDPDLAVMFEGDRNIVLPANEPICIARKPLEGTYAQNAMKWGLSGGFNVDGNLNAQGRQPSSLISFDEGVFEGDYNKFFFCPKATKDDKDIPDIYVLNKDAPSHIQTWLHSRMGRKFFLESELDQTRREWFEPLLNDHDTIKNAANCERILARIVRPGFVVVDPFAGSGSILVAAKRLGCRVIGGDISERNTVISNARLHLAK
jgi:DNA modification methylase